jgi:hypothetical protein
MPPKAIQPQDTVISCSVCGRTLLQGEHPEIYLVNGTRRHVCDLCTVRANHQGWIREGEGPQIGHRAGASDRRPLLDRLRARRDRRGMVRRAEPAPHETPSEPGPVESAPGAEPVPEGPREPRHVHAVPTSEELKMARGVEVFNASEHPRTVAGIARSLGVPGVCVRAGAGQASTVGIIVAWELCWYRYEVDLADEATNGVRTAGQGYELSELAPEEQAANAAADEHGRLALAT